MCNLNLCLDLEMFPQISQGWVISLSMWFASMWVLTFWARKVSRLSWFTLTSLTIVEKINHGLNLKTPHVCIWLGVGVCSSSRYPWGRVWLMPKQSCRSQSLCHPHRPRSHLQSPCHFSTLQRLTWIFPGNYSTWGKAFSEFCIMLFTTGWSSDMQGVHCQIKRQHIVNNPEVDLRWKVCQDNALEIKVVIREFS